MTYKRKLQIHPTVVKHIAQRHCFQCSAILTDPALNFCDTVCRHAYNLYSWGEGRPKSGQTEYMREKTERIGEMKEHSRAH